MPIVTDQTLTNDAYHPNFAANELSGDLPPYETQTFV